MGGSYPLVIVLVNVSELGSDKKMQLFVRGQQTHLFSFENDETVANLKAFVCEKEGIPGDLVRLYCLSKPLDDDTVALGSLPSTCIEATTALLGGKVHGSLARAGKVKGQTPKVDKQEKKKKKTGRAKRRIQYNRRFVNVVQTFGRKRGPNANS